MSTTVTVEEGDEDEERLDIKMIQGFADKIQHLPGTRPKIVIPKRGEKDFEPLQETVNLQEMMLQRSREALFNALSGVRGGGSKSMSHALVTPQAPFTRMLVTRGHIHDTLGISVRQAPRFGSKAQTSTELLPEEALYLLERGSLQIWIGNEAETETDHVLGVGEWSDKEYGVRGAVEMSVTEGYAMFIGREGLTWERYQAYAYLKRLGYTVHRARRFLPSHFIGVPSTLLADHDPRLPRFRSWWLSLSSYITHLLLGITRQVTTVLGRMVQVGISNNIFRGTLLDRWSGKTHPSLLEHLRIVPAGHDSHLSSRPKPPSPSSIYSALDANPYLPFFHVWKPATPWSKAKWDKGSDEGLARQKPDYFLGVIDARTVLMPTIHQLSDIFASLPDEAKGPIKRQGPQYARPARSPSAVPYINPMGALRNGDRGLVIAVNDSGNTGWVRFGRAGFAEALML